MKDSGENMGKHHYNSLIEKQSLPCIVDQGLRQQEEKQLTLNPRVAEEGENWGWNQPEFQSKTSKTK